MSVSEDSPSLHVHKETLANVESEFSAMYIKTIKELLDLPDKEVFAMWGPALRDAGEEVTREGLNHLLGLPEDIGRFSVSLAADDYTPLL